VPDAPIACPGVDITTKTDGSVEIAVGFGISANVPID
tara:strand:- start:943 stop:1053 length:111 start_codon:yes stop_codon:yes gene_type:complete